MFKEPRTRMKSAFAIFALALTALIAPAAPAQAAVTGTISPAYTVLGATGDVAFTISVSGLTLSNCAVDTVTVTVGGEAVTDEVGTKLTSTTAKIEGTLVEFAGSTRAVKDIVWNMTFADDGGSCGQATVNKTIADYVYYAVPTISTISPDSGTSAGGTVVTLTGTGLIDGDTKTVVKFGTASATVLSSSATSLRVLSPAKPTSYDNVEVTNRGGVDTIDYTYVIEPVVSDFTLVSDAGVKVGSVEGGDPVYIYGSGFDNVTSVVFGDAEATNLTINSTKDRIRVLTPAHSAGEVRIKVSDGTTTFTTTDTFRFTAAPTITRVEPNTGALTAGTVVTITGTNFFGVTDVRFDTSSATDVTVNDAGTSMTVKAPAHAAGAVKVSVTNPAGTTQTSTTVYTYAASAITTVAPAYGSTIGGTAVTITGVGLTLTTAVKFGSTAATSFTVNSAGTTIIAIAPAGTGVVAINLTVAGATVSKTNAFTYIDAPVVSTISPRKGSKLGGTVVTVVGSNLQLLSSVKFGDLSATSIVVNADGTSATFVSPASTTTGTVALRLLAAGGAVTVPMAFTYQEALCTPGALGQITFPASKSALSTALKAKLDIMITALKASGCSTLIVKRFKVASPGTATLKAMNALAQKRAETSLKYIRAQLAKAGLTVQVVAVKLPGQVTKMAFVDAVKTNRVVKFAMK